MIKIMTKPTLSVVLPNYNHAKFLPRAIEALVNQTRPPDELFIIDDASTDNSVEVIEPYLTRYSFIRFLRNPKNMGVNAANRKLFALAQGDYIHPCAADDLRFPRFFELAMEMVERYPQAGIVFGDIQVKNGRDEEIGHVSVQQWQEPLYAAPDRFLDEYLDAELASHSTSPAMIYRRDAFEEVGWYREELESWADTFAARAIGLKYGACYIPENVAVDYRLEGSYSQGIKDDPRRAIDIVSRAARLMRSDEFRGRFPEQHVRNWESQFRRLVAWNYLLGSETTTRRSSFLVRNIKRLPRLLATLAVLSYKGDTSCYDTTEQP